MKITLKKAAVLSTALAVAAAALAGTAWAGEEESAPRACEHPADVLDLSNWKITLPTGEDEEPTEVTQPELATFSADPWFTATEDCSGVQFRSAVNGVTTGGSSYPRSELREMSGDGSEKAEWSTSEGTHTMVVKEAITKLPNDKQHVVAGQIHGGDDDLTVFRLEGTKLYITKEDDANYHLVTDDYKLGTPFEAKFVARDGKIEAYYNGELQTTLDLDSSTAYFKVGAYTQANCEKSDPCDDTNYGEVVVNSVTVTHEN